MLCIDFSQANTIDENKQIALEHPIDLALKGEGCSNLEYRLIKGKKYQGRTLDYRIVPWLQVSYGIMAGRCGEWVSKTDTQKGVVPTSFPLGYGNPNPTNNKYTSNLPCFL